MKRAAQAWFLLLALCPPIAGAGAATRAPGGRADAPADRPVLAAPRDPLPGRLFHSAAERAALDHVGVPDRPPAPRAAGRTPPGSPEASPALTGFVLRSDGRNSYWLEAPPAAEAGRLKR